VKNLRNVTFVNLTQFCNLPQFPHFETVAFSSLNKSIGMPFTFAAFVKLAKI